MAYQPVDIGSAPNDGTGDPIRDAFDKCNDNFVELYAGLTGLLDFKGSTDCSANPNYPAASKGDTYLVSVAGKIGGASGKVVEVGDFYLALADNAGGTEASVGTSWSVLQGNITATTPTDLDDLTDVNAPTPANGDVLTWDSTPGEWVPAAPAGGSFTAASTTEVLTGTDSSKGVTPDSLAALWEQGSDVASAGTISLGEGGYFHVTGTTTITDIDFATDKAGRAAWVEFTGILTLTHNASTLILPTGANITTAAGDTACFVSEGTDIVRCVAYNRASGAALASSATPGRVLITETVTSSSQATVSFSSFSSSYRDLEIRVRGRCTDAGADQPIRIRFNSDSGSNYDYQQTYMQSNVTVVQSATQTSILGGQIPAAGSTANFSGVVVVDIGDYRGTTFYKNVITRSGENRTGTGQRTMLTSGQWRSTSAITTIVIDFPAGNFVDGTVVSLYGLM